MADAAGGDSTLKSGAAGLATPLAVAVLGVILVWFGPLFLGAFAANVLTRSMLYAALAATVDLLWGYAGILTFGQAAFFGVGAYATALTMTSYGATPGSLAGALGLAILVPTLLGALVGWLSFYYGSTPLYASVISLVFPIVVTQLIYSGGAWTGSSSGLVGYDSLPLDLTGFFRLNGFFLVAIVAAAWIFVRSDAGKLLVALRDNEMRCDYLGLDPKRLQIILTTVMAGIAGVAGFLFAQSSGVVAPENASFVFGTELVIWTALGGRASLLGPVLVAVGVDYLSASLSGDLPFIWQLLLGGAFVITIILLPNGAAGLARKGFAALRRNAAPAPRVRAIGERESLQTPDGVPLLEIAGLTRGFGSLSVLKDIDLKVQTGALLSVVGPNGAGKTTLMRCLSDGREPFRGLIKIAGVSIAGLPPNRVAALGVGRKFQIASIFETLSVSECLRLARASREFPSLWRTTNELRLPAASAAVLETTGLSERLTAPASLLSHGLKQALELAMVLALEPRLILLDEPTAGLTKAERTTIGAVLKNLAARADCSVILVEHDLDFVRQISSRIVVLHQGRLAMDGAVEEVVGSATVRAIYAGGGHV